MRACVWARHSPNLHSGQYRLNSQTSVHFEPAAIAAGPDIGCAELTATNGGLMHNAAWLRVTEARRQTPVFAMPAADAMASADIGHIEFAVQSAQSEQAVRAAQLAQLAQLRPLAQAALAERPSLACVAAALSGLPEPVFENGAHTELDCRLAEEPHDAFFRIVRCCDPAATALARASLRAIQVFIEEADDETERCDYAGLELALQQVLSEVLGCLSAPAPALAPVAVLHAPQPLMRARQPLSRWLRGHQIFAVLTQGLIRQLHRVVREVEAPPTTSVDSMLNLELDRMAALYRASALAFRFTADFDPAIYAQTIRPSMCEPYTPKGFSGTLSSDHGVLVKLLVGRREALAQASQRCPSAYAAMRSAIASVYDDHKWVCARFDGDRGPSLRSASVNGEQTAVEMLDRFRTRRIAMLP